MDGTLKAFPNCLLYSSHFVTFIFHSYSTCGHIHSENYERKRFHYSHQTSSCHVFSNGFNSSQVYIYTINKLVMSFVKILRAKIKRIIKRLPHSGNREQYNLIRRRNFVHVTSKQHSIVPS